MHDLRRHALIVVVVGAFVLSQSMESPAGESVQSVGGYFYCASEPGEPVVYFSDFFVAKPGGSVPTAHNAAQLGPDPSIKIQDDFFAYLKHKYAFKSSSNFPTGCPSFGFGAYGLSLAKDSKKNAISQYTQARKKIVETGWKYPH